MEKVKNVKSIAVKFNLDDGISPDVKSKKRFLSEMEGIYYNNEELKKMLSKGNPIVYEFYDLDIPESEGNIKFGTTILYPGKVGNEFFMTKGHFHEILDTAEIYYCIRGHGYMLMENTEGNVEVQEMTAGISVYVPPGFAHRSINVSEKEPLISFFAYRADAGHDYKTIEMKGFRKLVLEKGGKPDIIDNPKWIK
jgi:glucose-6-phosphate isomerase